MNNEGKKIKFPSIITDHEKEVRKIDGMLARHSCLNPILSRNNLEILDQQRRSQDAPGSKLDIKIPYHSNEVKKAKLTPMNLRASMVRPPSFGSRFDLT